MTILEPGRLTDAFAELLDGILAPPPSGERWTCACGASYRVPSGLAPKTRRTLWKALLRTHSSARCSVEATGLGAEQTPAAELAEAREQLADLRQRIARAIDVCGDPGLVPMSSTLAAEINRILSTQMVRCRKCSEAGVADRSVWHEAPECKAP